MAAVEAARSRLGIAFPGETKTDASGWAATASSRAFAWDNGEKINDMNLVFAFQEGRVPVQYLWRHKALNPRDRAPSPEDRTELEHLAKSLEGAIATVSVKLHTEDLAHRKSLISSGLVKKYTGDFVANQVVIDGIAYLRSDFPPSRKVDDLRDYAKFIAAESMASVLGYFVSRGYTAWTPLLEEMMVKSMK